MNNTKPSCIVFTLYYPYSNFENYFEEEIRQIALSFETVYLVSQNFDAKIKREVPANVVLINKFYYNKGSYNLLSCFFSSLFWREFLKALCKNKVNLAFIKNLINVYGRVTFYIHLLKSILSSNEYNKVAVIYTQWLLEGLYAAATLKEKFEFNLISRAHSLDIYKERHINHYIPFFDTAIQKVDEVHFISQLGKIYFIENYHYKQSHSRLKVSFLGVPEVNTPVFKIEDGVLRIISVCYIYPLKRLDLIVEALAQITDFRVEWHHIGGYYAEHTEKIKHKANELLSSKKNITVKWLGDFSAQEVYNYYAQHSFDLFVSTSSSEGIPVSMMECMSFGIPVMSTNVGGVYEIVEDHKNGILLARNPNAIEISTALNSYFHLNLESRKIMSQAAYHTWKTKFNAIENYQKFAENLVNYLS